MMKGKSGRWGIAAWLAAAVLLGPNLGCQPASSTGTSPTPSKSDKQPADKKDGTVKPPQPDPG